MLYLILLLYSNHVAITTGLFLMEFYNKLVILNKTHKSSELTV